MFYAFLFIFLQISTIFADIHLLNSDENVSKDEMVQENSIKLYSDLKSLVCSSIPSTCSTVESFSRKLFDFGVFEARGPKDLIAIISTMLASFLGAILVKLNVLIVLSMISVGIGKLLLIILTLKSHIFSQKTQSPVVYEKVYYPKNHQEYSQLPQSLHEDYPSYNYSS